MRGRPKAQGKGKPYSLCLSASDGWAGGWSIKRLERSVGFRRHLWYNVPRAFIFEDKPCDVSLGLEPSLWAASLYAYGYSAQGLYVVGTNDARSPWAWRNWLSVGTTSSRFAAPPILPLRLYNKGREKCDSISRERCR